ncbi:MAG: hypothetical protein IPJ07_14415 [Acidobacteria bacterium]|nr:hypothetical protein [Acidobacteriota bacterium]
MIKHSANKLTTEDRQSILEGLLDCDSQEEFWWGIISDLPPEIKLGFDRSASIKERVDNLVKKALEFPNGIETLISRVRFRQAEIWHGIDLPN